MSNQQRTPRRCATQTSSELRCCVSPLRTSQWWHPRSWRNIWQTRPAQNRVPNRACRFKSCRAHKPTNYVAPLGKLEKPPDLGSGAWGFDSLAGHHASLAQKRRATGS